MTVQKVFYGICKDVCVKRRFALFHDTAKPAFFVFPVITAITVRPDRNATLGVKPCKVVHDRAGVWERAEKRNGETVFSVSYKKIAVLFVQKIGRFVREVVGDTDVAIRFRKPYVQAVHYSFCEKVGKFLI